MGIPWEAGEQGMPKRELSRSERGLSPLSSGRLYKFRCPKCRKYISGRDKSNPPVCPYCKVKANFEGDW